MSLQWLSCLYIWFRSIQRLPNGSIDVHDDTTHAIELQELLDKANKDLSASRERANTLNTSVAELESELANVRKELLKSEEFNAKHQRDIREVSVSHTPPKHTNACMKCVY